MLFFPKSERSKASKFQLKILWVFHLGGFQKHPKVSTYLIKEHLDVKKKASPHFEKLVTLTARPTPDRSKLVTLTARPTPDRSINLASNQPQAEPELCVGQLLLQHPYLLLHLGQDLLAVPDGHGLHVLQPALQLLALGQGCLGRPDGLDFCHNFSCRAGIVTTPTHSQDSNCKLLDCLSTSKWDAWCDIGA